MSKKIFGNGFAMVATCKSKVTLKLNKQAYAGMYVLDLSEALMWKVNYDCFKYKCGRKWRLIFTDTEYLYEELANKSLVIIQLSQNIMMIQKN